MQKFSKDRKVMDSFPEDFFMGRGYCGKSV